MTSVVIPVFNKYELTHHCLQSILLDSSIEIAEIFVIDNGSTDETHHHLPTWIQKFAARKTKLKIIHNPKNVGFGRACNQGIREAQGNYIAIVNNDTWLMKGWDQALKKAMKEHDLDCVGPFFDERKGIMDFEKTASEYLSKKTNQGKIREHFVPILMFFKREAVDRLRFDHGGIFDEIFFVTYEDTDLLYRMRELNMKHAQTSDCYIWHQSMGTRNSGALPSGYEAEGLKLFEAKWGFDPRPAEHTFMERMKRKWRKWRASQGLF